MLVNMWHYFWFFFSHLIPYALLGSLFVLAVWWLWKTFFLPLTSLLSCAAIMVAAFFAVYLSVLMVLAFL